MEGEEPIEGEDEGVWVGRELGLVEPIGEDGGLGGSGLWGKDERGLGCCRVAILPFLRRIQKKSPPPRTNIVTAKRPSFEEPLADAAVSGFWVAAGGFTAFPGFSPVDDEEDEPCSTPPAFEEVTSDEEFEDFSFAAVMCFLWDPFKGTPSELVVRTGIGSDLSLANWVAFSNSSLVMVVGMVNV